MIKKQKIGHLLLSLVLTFTSMNIKLEEVYGTDWKEVVLDEGVELGTPVYERVITPRINAWQYGDYWKIGDKQISNKDVGRNVDKLAELYDTYVETSMDLPSEVIEGLNNGQQLTIKATNGSEKAPIKTIYEINNSNYDNPSYRVEDGKLYFKAYPKFNIDGGKKYTDLLGFVEDEIPIVHSDFGGNIYSMFNKNDINLGSLGYAYADNYDPKKNDGSIHYSDVVTTKGYEGEIKDGLNIEVIEANGAEKKTYASEDLRIGENTNLSKSAAMGMFFLYPTKLEFYLSGQQIEVSHVDIDTGEELEPKLIEEISLKTYSKKEFEDYEYIEYEFSLGDTTEPRNPEVSKEITQAIIDTKENAKLTFYYESTGSDETEGGGGDLEGEDLKPEAKGQIIAEEKGAEKFDVSLGIPTTEKEYILASAKNYLYRYSFTKIEDKVIYPVEVIQTYELKWKEEIYNGEDEDGDDMYSWIDRSDAVTVSETYPVPREYAYWITNEVTIAPLSKLDITNYSLPNEKVSITEANALEDLDIPEVSITPPSEGQIKDPKIYNARVELPIKELNGGKEGRPDVPDEDFTSVAEKNVGEILVANDSITVGGEVVSVNDYVEKETSTPNVSPIKDNKIIDFEVRNLNIDYNKKNGIYESEGEVYYAGIEAMPKTFDVNNVVIHTPTYVDGKVYNDKEFNQEIHYQENEYASIILDRPGSIIVKTDGKHRDILGYGEQDYKEYTGLKQVKFPFDVYFDTTTGEDNNKFVPANTWINLDLNKNRYDYYVPTWVDEGDYTIEYRTSALNAEYWDEPSGENANLDLSQYIAEDSTNVRVIGRVFGFKVTDYITDFIANVENEVTEKIVGQKGSTSYYPVGPYDENGDLKKLSDGKLPSENLINNDYAYLPMIPGSAPDKFHGELDKGYAFAFELTTIGNYDGIGDGIYITPTYYHIDLDGNVTEVDIYVKTDKEDRENGEFLLTKLEDYEHNNKVALEDNYRMDRWEEADFIEVEEDLKELGYTGQDARVYLYNKRTRDLGDYSYIYINEFMRTFEGQTENLPEGVNEDKARKSVQQWYGEFGLPAEFYVVEKGFDIENAVYPDLSIGKEWHGFDYKEPFFIRDGYIMVNFKIDTVKGENLEGRNLNDDMKDLPLENRELSYGFYAPNSNMWKIEGGMRAKEPRMVVETDMLDEYDGLWGKYYGDIISYNMKYSIHDDYKVVGSH